MQTSLANNSLTTRYPIVVGLPQLTLALSTIFALVQISGGAIGLVATTLSLFLAARLAFLANPRYLSSLLVLYLPNAGITAFEIQRSESAYVLNVWFPEATTELIIGGIQISVPLVVAVIAAIIVMVEAKDYRRVYAGIIPKFFLIAWILAFLPALIGAWEGQSLGYNRWSQGIRALFSFGGFFWGIVLVSHDKRGSMKILDQIGRYILIGSILFIIGILRGHIYFLICGLSAAWIPVAWHNKKKIATLLLSSAATVAMLLGSLTTVGEVLFGLSLSLIACTRSFSIRWLSLQIIGLFSLLISLTVLFSAIMLPENFMLPTDAGLARRMGLSTYILYKIMVDRARFWIAASEQIWSGPYLIVPSGRPLLGSFAFGGKIINVWDAGSHNTILETLRHSGFLAGSIGLAIAIFAIFACLKVLGRTNNRSLKCLSAGVFGIAITTSTTGNLPMFEQVGFLLWTSAGVVAALYQRERRERWL